MKPSTLPPSFSIAEDVSRALLEDIGTGDLTSQLIDPERTVRAQLIAHEAAMIVGLAWANETLHQTASQLHCDWRVQDGDTVTPGQVLALWQGPAQAILTAERTALNFLQILSGTATLTAHYAQRIKHTNARLLDTRKTIPGLRLAQKYAVRCGGGHHHRVGLYDAFFIKENHRALFGDLHEAIAQAKRIDMAQPIAIEITPQDSLDDALNSDADILLLHQFSLEALQKTVEHNTSNKALAAAGHIDVDHVQAIAETGVDFISLGTITQQIRAINLSLRVN